MQRADLQKLIEIVRINSCLYDSVDPEHRDALLIIDVWNSIAQEMAFGNMTDGDNFHTLNKVFIFYIHIVFNFIFISTLQWQVAAHFLP